MSIEVESTPRSERAAGASPAPAQRAAGIESEPMLLDAEPNRRVVDGVRAIGILLVILFHTLFGMSKLLPAEGLRELMDELPFVLNGAWQALGSEVIFFLSGFLLSYLGFREVARRGTIDVRDHIVRRASRILPLYFVGFALYYLAGEVKWDGRPGWFDGQELALNLLFVSKVFHEKTVIPVGWSLEVMVQYYILLPPLVLLVAKMRRPLLFVGVLLVASVAVRAIVLAGDPASYETAPSAFFYGAEPSQLQKDLYYLLWFRATPFLGGLFVAFLIVRERLALARFFESRTRSTVAFAVGAAVVAAMWLVPAQHPDSPLTRDVAPSFWLWFWTLQRPILCVGLGLVLLSVLHARDGLAALAAKPLRWSGFATVSRNIYGIYLFHFPMLIPAAALAFWTIRQDDVTSASPWHVLVIFVVASLLATGFAALMTRWIEVPAQRWLRGRFSTERRARR